MLPLRECTTVRADPISEKANPGEAERLQKVWSKKPNKGMIGSREDPDKGFIYAYGECAWDDVRSVPRSQSSTSPSSTVPFRFREKELQEPEIPWQHERHVSASRNRCC